MTQSMIEKVARAIYERDEAETAYPQPWDDAGPLTKQHAVNLARAAIEAMREPTDAMMDCGTDRDDGGDPTNAKGVYRAMIDAALGDKNAD